MTIVNARSVLGRGTRAAICSALIGVWLFCLGLHAATIDVRNYGATGNASTDDTNALQTAINALRSGDTLIFPAGTYKTTKVLTLKSNATYTGQPGSIIKQGKSTAYYLLEFGWEDAANTTIQGLTLDGGGINLPGNGANVSNIVITHNTIQNITNGCAVGQTCNWTRAIDSLLTMTRSKITWNKFSNLMILYDTSCGAACDDDAHWNGNAGGVHGYCWDNVQINNNWFDRVNESINSSETSGVCVNNLEIGSNVLTNLHRMGVEFQSQVGSGLVVHDNFIKDWVQGFWWSYGLSITSGSANSHVYNNQIYSTTPTSIGIALEGGGVDSEYDHNIINGPWVGGITPGGPGPVNVHDNKVCGPNYETGYQVPGGYRSPIGYQGTPNPGDVFSNNTVTVACGPIPPTPDTSLMGAGSVLAAAAPPMITVTTGPSSTALGQGQSQQFSASVTGTNDPSVDWSISPVIGTISASGLYAAPMNISSTQTITVTATSAADRTKSARSTVTLSPPAPVPVAPPLPAAPRFVTITCDAINVDGTFLCHGGLH